MCFLIFFFKQKTAYEMRISDWSSDVCSSDLLEVEGITDPAAVFAPFVVAEVKKAEPHPNADKLRVCEVFTGTETFQVVCGAPNARAGMKGVFAPVGSTVPGINLLLKAATIRSAEHTSELQSLMRISYAVFCLKK